MALSPATLRAGGAALALLLLTGCAGPGAPAGTSGPTAAGAPPSADHRAVRHDDRAVVHRVVDGDTVDVVQNGETVRVRLLNIDTPETEDPNRLVECLGPEAAAFLEQLLPPGTEVGLAYDQQRTDDYGRTLAGVFTADGTLVNAQIARRGLGTPLYVEPNARFLPSVELAFREAEQEQRGLLDPARGCTLPARVEQTAGALQNASPADLADPASPAAEAAAFLGALDAVDGDAHPHLRHLTELPGLHGAVSDVRGEVAGLQAQATEQRRKASPGRETPVEPGAPRQAEAGTPAADRAAPAPAPPAPVPPAPAPPAPALPAPAPPVPAPPPGPALPAPIPAPVPAPLPPAAPAPAPDGNVGVVAPPGYHADLPGYTGPRCYAPGGQFFTPC